MLDDPAGNSFLQGLFGEEDSALTVEHYQRSPEQDKKLHLGSEVTDTTGNVSLYLTWSQTWSVSHMVTDMVCISHGHRHGLYLTWSQTWSVSHMVTDMVCISHGHRHGLYLTWSQTWSVSHMVTDMVYRYLTCMWCGHIMSCVVSSPGHV